jgi:hypothetical protein
MAATPGHWLLAASSPHWLPLAVARWHSLPSYVKIKIIFRPKLSRPLCLSVKYPAGAQDQICITVRQSQVCLCGAPSLTRGWVCRLQLLLDLTSAVILGSESCRTHDHILLPQIRDTLNLEGQVSVFTFPKVQGGTVLPPRSRFPFSSPPTTRRATVEVFELPSTRG